MSKSFEDRIFDAVVEQFFSPYREGRTPVMFVADELFRQKNQEIMAAVIEKLDIEDLAEQVAKRVVSELTSKPDGWGRDDNTAIKAEMTKRVREKVADALAARQLAKLDEAKHD